MQIPTDKGVWFFFCEESETIICTLLHLFDEYNTAESIITTPRRTLALSPAKDVQGLVSLGTRGALGQ